MLKLFFVETQCFASRCRDDVKFPYIDYAKNALFADETQSIVSLQNTSKQNARC